MFSIQIYTGFDYYSEGIYPNVEIQAHSKLYTIVFSAANEGLRHSSSMYSTDLMHAGLLFSDAKNNGAQAGFFFLSKKFIMVSI